MQHRHLDTEVVAQAVDERRGQGDLGHQHQRTSASVERRRDGLRVDRGLATRRIALEQHRFVTARLDGVPQDRERCFLLGIELGPGWTAAARRLGPSGQRAPLDDPYFELEESPLGEPGDRRCAMSIGQPSRHLGALPARCCQLGQQGALPRAQSGSNRSAAGADQRSSITAGRA